MARAGDFECAAVLGAVQAGAVLPMLGRDTTCAWVRAVLASLAAWTTPARGGGGRGAPRALVRGVGDCGGFMLRIYPVLIELVAAVAPSVRLLERRDPDLAKQCRRALTSAPLNVAEGSCSRGKRRAASYHIAAGSLREAQSCFEVAAALGYMPALDAAAQRSFGHVLGTLVKLAGGHR